MKLGFLTDIHEDLGSLIHALRKLEKHQCDELVCLGDIAGFCIPNKAWNIRRDANEVIRLIMQNCKYTVCGNHDLYAIRKLPVSKAGLDYPEGWFEMSYAEKAKLFYGKIWLYDDEIPTVLNDNSKEFLSSLPETLVVNLPERRILLTHYLAPDITGCTTRLLSSFKGDSAHMGLMKKNYCNLAFVGHSHVEGHALLTEKRLKIKPFSKDNLKENNQIVACPCVIRSGRQNGFLVYDSTEHYLQSIAI